MHNNWTATLKARRDAALAACTETNLEDLTTTELRDRCAAAGLPWVGKTRDHLIAQLTEEQG